MPRKSREEVAGGIYHVFARGNRQQRIYLDDADCVAYLRMLGRTARWSRWRCLAFCLMVNHVHLVIELTRPNLGAGLQRLHGRYAQVFNERHRRSGHLFQGRYGAIRVCDDAQLWTVVGYVACNPVQAGLCAAPEEWRWSSYRHVVARSAPPWLDVARLLSYLGALGGDPLQRYADLVDRTPQHKGSDPLGLVEKGDAVISEQLGERDRARQAALPAGQDVAPGAGRDVD